MASRSMTNGERGGYWLYIAAIAVALTMIVSMAMLTPAEEEDRWAVQSGDVLQYDITGHLNGTAVTGTAIANFTVVNMTGHGGSVGGYFTTDLGDWTGRGVTDALSSPSRGACLGWEWIDTAFGRKAVTRYVDHYGGNGSASVITTYAGVDSRVIYRINASGPGSFLGLELEASTVEGMEHLDTRAPADVPSGFKRPVDSEFMEIGSPGVVLVAYWDLPAGTMLNHTLGGDGSRFYLFTEENLEHMEHGAALEHDTEMSLTSGNGTRSAILDGGRYMAVIDFGAEGSWQRFEITYPS